MVEPHKKTEKQREKALLKLKIVMIKNEKSQAKFTWKKKRPDFIIPIIEVIPKSLCYDTYLYTDKKVSEIKLTSKS